MNKGTQNNYKINKRHDSFNETHGRAVNHLINHAFYQGTLALRFSKGTFMRGDHRQNTLQGT